jgi:hypothetical protein
MFACLWHDTAQAYNNPSDALAAELEAQGHLMPPQLCNGTLLGDTLTSEAVDVPHGPVWITDTPLSFVNALREAVEATTTAARTDVSNAAECHHTTMAHTRSPMFCSLQQRVLQLHAMV